MTDADWLRALGGALDNAAERAAYADWLDDHSDPRAETVRLDLLLCDLSPADPRYVELLPRLAELVRPLDLRWRAVACRVPVDHGEPAARPDWALGPPGPWYQIEHCNCASTSVLAGDLFTSHVLTIQPDGPAETWRLASAALACERNVIRYGGQDPAVIGLLGNHPDYCDFLIQDDPPAVVRDRVWPDPDDDVDEWEMTADEWEREYGPQPSQPARPPAPLSWPESYWANPPGSSEVPSSGRDWPAIPVARGPAVRPARTSDHWTWFVILIGLSVVMKMAALLVAGGR